MLQEILKAPLYLIQIFTDYKSFKDNPILGSKVLNVLGLHVIRLLVAHGLTWLKRFFLSWRIDKQYRRSFLQNGFVLIENFLEEDDFNKLNQAMREFRFDMRECHQGDTITQRILFDDVSKEKAPIIEKTLFNNRTISSLFRYGGAANHSPLLYKENVKNGFHKTQKDPQKNLHSDTFHPTVKGWLYLDDVTIDNGTFCYVPRSNRLTWKRIKWEYKNSIQAARSKDSYTKKGSFRFNQNDLKALNLNEPICFVVKKNTLLFADTYGIHKRGHAEQGSERLSIFMMDRSNPFWPLPSFDFEIFRKWRVAYIKRKMTLNEERSLKQKRQPMWRRST